MYNMNMQGSFNANQYEPNQGGGGNHPPAQKIPFNITGTSIEENSSKDGGFFKVELTSPLGTQIVRYNIWNKTPKAVEIAHGQLSALCRATGRFQIDWANEGAALRGGQGLMDIGFQKGEEPTAEKPNGGYTELKKVYDLGGNEPGKSGNAQPQPQTQAQPAASQPMTAQPGGGWGQTASQPQATQQAPQTSAAPQGQAWAPGGNGGAPAGGTPPWGQR
jgi:hypothetical protein